MALDVWFDAPTTTEPLTSTALSVLVRVRWSLTRFKPKGPSKIVLTSSATATISPNDGVYPVVGSETTTVFTVLFAAPVSSVTLTVKLFVSGDTSGDPDDSDTATIQVSGSDSGTGGGDIPVGEPLADAVRERMALEANVAPAGLTSGGPGGPVVLHGRATPANHYHPADAVVGLVYRMLSGGRLDIKYVGNAILTPKDGFVLLLDPAIRGQGFSCRLYLVSELGEILDIRHALLS